MGTAPAPQSFDLDAVAAGPRASTARTDDRRFALYVLLALSLHSLMLVSFNSGEPRRLGAEGGADDAISVSIITAKDLDGRATIEDRAAGAPVPSAPPARTETPAPPAPPQPEPPEKATPPDVATPPEPTATAAPPPPAAPEPAAEPAREPEPPAPLRPTLPEPALEPAPKAADAEPTPRKAEAKADPSPTETAATPKADTKPAEPPQKPAEAKPKPAEPKPKPKPAKPERTETAKLDLTPPAIFQAPVGGGGAGVQRPAGITRSGENDDFARGVILALQRTMPQLRNTFGRVTVRITLDMNGNLAGTVVMKPSSVAGLDQSVVFATQQSSFPFPPRNAKPQDLVFFVTYIYR